MNGTVEPGSVGSVFWVETIRFSACLFVESLHHHRRSSSRFHEKSIALCAASWHVTLAGATTASKPREAFRVTTYRWRDAYILSTEEAR
jgi:hypothetical protein